MCNTRELTPRELRDEIRELKAALSVAEDRRQDSMKRLVARNAELSAKVLEAEDRARRARVEGMRRLSAHTIRHSHVVFEIGESGVEILQTVMGKDIAAAERELEGGTDAQG